jgi:outer membrane protein TolC
VKNKTLAVIAVTGLLLVAVPSHAAPAPSDREGHVLSLADCLRQALENNLDLVAARNDPAIAAQQVDVTKAPFDGVLSAGGSYADTDGDDTIVENTTGASTDGKSESDYQEWDVSFSQLLQFGGNYSLTYNDSTLDYKSRSIEATTGFLQDTAFDQDSDGLTFAYEMPLLNGFGTEVNTIEILLAQGNLEISEEDLRLQAMQTMQSVEDAYWNVLAAGEALRISRLSLERAEDLLELNRKKVEVGTLAPIEITEAEAGVASTEEQVIIAETELENAEDVLLQLLAVPDSSPVWNQALELTDRPSWVPEEVDLEDAITIALERRPEIKTARKRLRDDELSERVAKRGVRHGLDLTASITPNQQQDTDRLVQILVPPGNPPSDTTTDAEDTDWQVGLRYSYPIRNRAAKARYAIARLQTAKSDVAVRNTEQEIRVDVRRSARNLESGLQRIEAARKNVELQEKKLDAEQKKFDNGMSTSFEVLTFQNDLADAELSEVRARLDYLKALTALERSKGTLLEARGLSLADSYE